MHQVLSNQVNAPCPSSVVSGVIAQAALRFNADANSPPAKQLLGHELVSAGGDQVDRVPKPTRCDHHQDGRPRAQGIL
jgi:hypothetical protein